MAQIDEITNQINEYLNERGWKLDQDRSRDVAISLSLEASELLEHYQWSDQVADPNEVRDELADVLIYAFQFAEMNDIDIPTAIEQKLAKQRIKYPLKEEM